MVAVYGPPVSTVAKLPEPVTSKWSVLVGVQAALTVTVIVGFGGGVGAGVGVGVGTGVGVGVEVG